MRIGFVIARIGNERNVIQRLSVALAMEMRKLDLDTVDIIRFSRKSCFNPLFYRKLKGYDCILIANVGLQCAFCSFIKRIHLVKLPFVVISFGSDIRATKHRIINIFNRMSKPAVNLLIVINPDLVDIATKRGYKNVKYVHSWAEVFTP
jgi:RNase P protein component